MRSPRARGSTVDEARLMGWVTRFAGYRRNIGVPDILSWLNQFDEPHGDLAARVLDAVRFISHEHVSAAYRSVLSSLPGWFPLEADRSGKWRFVALSSSAGESGDSMLHIFRRANALGSSRNSRMFIYKSDLLRESITSDDTVVFVDDFAGTGRQACMSWRANIRELLPGNPTTYLVLVAASLRAKKKIQSETDFQVFSHFTLSDRDNIFSPACIHFTESEKATLVDYNRKADRRDPRGFGGCGLLVVLPHSCPNDCIPILHRSHGRWRGLFREP
jgi:hypothetical protein